MTTQTSLKGMFQRKHEPVTFTQIITPEEAARMLKTMQYTHQRPLRPTKVQEYAEELRNSTFRELTQIFIAIYQGRYVILDGQHRLNAIVASGTPYLFTVVEKEVESEEELSRIYSTTDIGTRRTPSDIYGAYALADEFNLSKSQTDLLGAAIKFMLSGCTRTSGAAKPDVIIPHMRTYAPYMQMYGNILANINIGKAIYPATQRTSTTAAALLSLRFSVSKAEREGRPSVGDFWVGSLTDDGLRVGDPRKAAYRHLVETRIQSGHAARGTVPTRPQYSIRYLGSCLNSYIREQPLKYAKVFDELGSLNTYGIPNDPALWW